MAFSTAAAIVLIVLGSQLAVGVLAFVAICHLSKRLQVALEQKAASERRAWVTATMNGATQEQVSNAWGLMGAAHEAERMEPAREQESEESRVSRMIDQLRGETLVH